MLPRNTSQPIEGQNQPKDQPGNPANASSNENVRAAHEQADDDISKDPDFSVNSPNDDLDEGETARLGEDETGLV